MSATHSAVHMLGPGVGLGAGAGSGERAAVRGSGSGTSGSVASHWVAAWSLVHDKACASTRLWHVGNHGGETRTQDPGARASSHSQGDGL